jgi:ATP-dependent Clp protease ATP-binding subunit ClpA
VCQRALAEELRLVGAIRTASAALRDEHFDSLSTQSVSQLACDYMTARMQNVLGSARVRRGAASVRSIDLLIGLLDDDENLAVRVLRSLGVDTDSVRSAAKRDNDPEHDDPHMSSSSNLVHENIWIDLSIESRLVIASALEESASLGHRYLGCEHLLLGMLATAESGANRVLRLFALDSASVRRTVASAVVGYSHAQEKQVTIDARKLDEMLARLEVLENRLS